MLWGIHSAIIGVRHNTLPVVSLGVIQHYRFLMTGTFALPPCNIPRRGRLAKANLTLFIMVKFSERRNVLLSLVNTP